MKFLSQVHLRCISGIFQANLMHNLRHILGTYQAISGKCQVNVWQIVSIDQIYQANLLHIPGINQANLRQMYNSGYCWEKLWQISRYPKHSHRTIILVRLMLCQKLGILSSQLAKIVLMFVILSHYMLLEDIVYLEIIFTLIHSLTQSHFFSC